MSLTLTDNSNDQFALVDVEMTYPSFGLHITLVDLQKRQFNMVDDLESVDLMINSRHEDQKTAAQRALDSLMKALGITMPEVAKHQPPQVVAATYARLLQKCSWRGWLFSGHPKKLSLLKVTVQEGSSKHHHKKYYNYTFDLTGKEIERDQTLVRGYDADDNWWYYERLRPIVIKDVPEDFLLWFDEQKQDRGDIKDAQAIAKSLRINDKRLLQAMFYQIKFEMADVICVDSYYGNRAINLPGNIFEREVNPGKSLTGLMMRYFQQHKRRRPPVDKIYLAGINNKLPNHCWNGKWETKTYKKGSFTHVRRRRLSRNY